MIGEHDPSKTSTTGFFIDIHYIDGFLHTAQDYIMSLLYRLDMGCGLINIYALVTTNGKIDITYYL